MTAPSPFARFLAAGEDEVSAIETRTRVGTGAAAQIALDAPSQSARTPYVPLLLVGLGGLFAGVTGPLLSTFVPPLVRDALGDHRTAIGAVMAIDNVLLLLLVPWAGAASDRASARGRGRLPIVLCGIRAGGGRHGAVPVVGEVRHRRRDRRDRRAVHRNQRAAIALPGARGRSRAVALPLARDRIRHVPDVRRRDRLPDARPDARHAAGLPDRGGHRARDRGGASPSGFASRPRRSRPPPRPPSDRCSTPRGPPCAAWCRACAPSSSRRCCCS